MNPFTAYIELLAKPKTFYENYKDQPKKVLLLAYTLYAIVFAIGLILALAEQQVNALELTFAIIILLIMYVLGVPLVIGLTGAIYHIGVLLFGGRGITKSITIFGASLLIGIPYTLVNMVFQLALGDILSLIITIPIGIVALIHTIYAEIQGLQVHYNFSTGKALLISLFPLIVAAILGIIIFILMILVLIGIGATGGL